MESSEEPGQAPVVVESLDLRRMAVVALSIISLLLIIFIFLLAFYGKTIPDVMPTSLGAAIGALAGIVAQEKE